MMVALYEERHAWRVCRLNFSSRKSANSLIWIHVGSCRREILGSVSPRTLFVFHFLHWVREHGPSLQSEQLGLDGKRASPTPGACLTSLTHTGGPVCGSVSVLIWYVYCLWLSDMYQLFLCVWRYCQKCMSGTVFLVWQDCPCLSICTWFSRALGKSLRFLSWEW